MEAGGKRRTPGLQTHLVLTPTPRPACSPELAQLPPCGLSGLLAEASGEGRWKLLLLCVHSRTLRGLQAGDPRACRAGSGLSTWTLAQVQVASPQPLKPSWCRKRRLPLALRTSAADS